MQAPRLQYQVSANLAFSFIYTHTCTHNPDIVHLYACRYLTFNIRFLRQRTKSWRNSAGMRTHDMCQYARFCALLCVCGILQVCTHIGTCRVCAYLFVYHAYHMCVCIYVCVCLCVWNIMHIRTHTCAISCWHVYTQYHQRSKSVDMDLAVKIFRELQTECLERNTQELLVVHSAHALWGSCKRMRCFFTCILWHFTYV